MRPPNHFPPPDFAAGRRLIFPILFILVLLIGAFQSLNFYIESLWFGSLGFESVFWYTLKAQSLVFAVYAGISILTLWMMFRLVTPSSSDSRRSFVEFGGEKLFIPPSADIKTLIKPVSIILGIFVGLSFSSDWTKYVLFFNRADSSIQDPIFGKSLSFYLFTLPVMESIAAWVLAIGILTLVAAVILAVTDMTARFRGVSLGLSLLLLGIAGQTFIHRYMLLLQPHDLITGVSYVEASVVLPGLAFIIGALVLGSILAASNIRSGRIRNLAIAVAMPAFTYLIAGVLLPTYVTTFVVRPNELVRETPYIGHSIDFTRKAYGLDKVEEIPFEPRVANAVFDPTAHKETLDNIRLWDWRALQDTLRQVQEIRTYYDFPDVDVDRYNINGSLQAMMLATRELSLNKLPEGSRNWVNERLIYTHGYGVTMNPVSKFTKEGLPEFILSNMPVQSSIPELNVTRPEIYFGELTDWPVYVKTKQTEFNFPEGNANNYNTYEGTGGIRMGGFFRQLALAFAVGDIAKVPFSDDITADSALLMRRNIRERVTTLAPFLLFDDDPYIVAARDGRLYWMMDAYTVSDRYPYSRHLTAGNQSLNYIRNSIKAVVDAYNGTVTLYVFDNEDPIIRAWQQALPDLFAEAAEMPEILRAHVRYPELLFQIQASLYSTYHVQNAQVFYNREDIWTVAQQGRSQGGRQASDAIEPFFILMKFPGDTRQEFVSILPFTPANRNNLIGWLAARSDGEEYGKLRAYHFPKTRFVDGPLQIQARMDQNSQLSSQLTLWNQQGSTVIRGNLLVIPLDDTLLFAEPMYLQAERSPMPELRLVVLATQDRLAYAPTFEEALDILLRGDGATTSTEPPQQTTATTAATSQPNAGVPGTPSGTTPTPASIRTLVERANQSLTDYQRLTAEGKLGEAGGRLDELKRTLQELNRLGIIPN